MLNELKSSTTLLQFYLTWLINMSSGGVATYILFMFFTLFLMVEFCDPREKILPKQLRQSYRANIELFVFNSVVMSILSAPSLLILAEQFSDKGLLNHIHNPVWRAVLSFLAIDLLLYFLHKASHSFDCLWDVSQGTSQRSLFECFNGIPDTFSGNSNHQPHEGDGGCYFRYRRDIVACE